MNKISAGRAIRFGYAFTFGHLGAIIGLIWIAAVMDAVLKYFSMGPYYRETAMALAGGPPVNGATMLGSLVYVFAGLFLSAVMAGGVARQAMGLRTGPATAYFAAGLTELRIFGGTIGLLLLMVVFLALVLALNAGAASVLVGVGLPRPAAAGITGIAMLAGLALVLYAMIRLSCLFIPAAINGNGNGLARSWQLTRGNFWRVAAVGIACLVPISIVYFGVVMAIVGPDYLAGMQPGEDAAARTAQLALQMRVTTEKLPMLVGIGFVLSPLLYGLTIAPAVDIWKQLTGAPQNPAP